MPVCCGWILFLTKRSLDQHLRSAVHDTGIPCVVCRACFKNQSLLNQHYKGGHHLLPPRPAPRVHCASCVLEFRDQSEFDRHVVDRHSLRQSDYIADEPSPVVEATHHSGINRNLYHQVDDQNNNQIHDQPPVVQSPSPSLVMPSSPPTGRFSVPAGVQTAPTPQVPAVRDQRICCPLCPTPTYFADQDQLRTHISSASAHQWRCWECDVACYSMSRLTEHCSRFHAEPQAPLLPETQAAQPSSAPTSTYKQPTQNTQWPIPTPQDGTIPSHELDYTACSLCGDVLNNRDALKEHMTEIHGRLITKTPQGNLTAAQYSFTASIPPEIELAEATPWPAQPLSLSRRESSKRRPVPFGEQCDQTTDVLLVMDNHSTLLHALPVDQTSDAILDTPKSPPSGPIASQKGEDQAAPQPSRRQPSVATPPSDRQDPLYVTSSDPATVSLLSLEEHSRFLHPSRAASNQRPRAPPQLSWPSYSSVPHLLPRPAQNISATSRSPGLLRLTLGDSVAQGRVMVGRSVAPVAGGAGPVRALAQQLPRTNPPNSRPIQFSSIIQPTSNTGAMKASEPTIQQASGSHVNQDASQTTRPPSARQPPRTILTQAPAPQRPQRPPFHCVPCVRNFKDQRALDSHLSSNAHNITCRTCGALCSDRPSLHEHLAAHHGRRAPAARPSVPGEFHCAPCVRDFTNQASLDCHLDSGLHRLQFLCDVCPGVFSMKHVLDRHRAAQHPGAPARLAGPSVVEKAPRVNCALCQRSFVDQYAVDQHLVSKAHLDRKKGAGRGTERGRQGA